MLDVQGWTFRYEKGQGKADRVPHKIEDRFDVVIPELILEYPRADLCMALKPTFDLIANAVHYEASRSYGSDGKWNRQLP